jgi:RNA polymerase sigma factor (sigma-70 family)
MVDPMTGNELNINHGEGALILDEGLFKKLLTDWYDQLVFFATRIVREESPAYELVSDRFIELWNKREELSFANEGAIKRWLFIAVRNRAYNHLNSSRVYKRALDGLKHISAVSDSIINFEDPDGHLEKSERIASLYGAIEELRPRYRRVLKMKLEGKSYEEISIQLNVPQSTVRSQFSRAIEILQKRFAGDLAVAMTVISFGFFYF